MAGNRTSRRAPAPADILAVLDGMQSAIDALRALVVGGVSAPAAAPAPSADWRKLKDAARELQVHPETLARHARKHGFGRRVPGGAWRIDMDRHAAWVAGRPFEPLMSEDVEKCRKMSDDADGASASD